MCDVESEPEPAPAAAAADCEEAPGDVGTTRLPDLSPDGWPIYPSVTERYFTTYVTSNHQALHVHSNGICLLGLAPSHPLLAPGAARITGVAFRDHDAKNLLANEVRGKRKSGAVFVLPRDLVASVTTEAGGDPLPLWACVRANVIEVNRRLIEEPELLGSAGGRGWLAVLMPKMAEKGSIGAALLELDRTAPLRDPTGNHKRRRDQQDASAPGGDEQQPRVSRKAARRARVCWDFAETGTCKFADKCRFRHAAPSEAPSEAAPSVGGAEPSGGAEAGEAADAGDGGESGGVGSGGAEGGCWC
mmetsp:Transcript_23642/g.69298  ORF Transcript_23642/g.69298 Transcript_23642/m.69298 type:complete len:303 (+) Transcript_23642:32-940(+)